VLTGAAGAQPRPADPALRAELLRVHAQLLRRPGDTQLNLRYARIAEQLGETRKALVAYERVVLNDPGNPEAEDGLLRIRRKLQPDQTWLFTEFGAAWESNPRQLPAGAKSEWEALARIMVRDERALGSTRWRTEAIFVGNAHQLNSDLNYAYGGVLTGPVVDLTPHLAMFVGLGGGAAYFDHRFFYGDANAVLGFETSMAGAPQTVRVRAGFRDYNSFFPSDQGPYADIVGRFLLPNVIASDLIVVSPWLRWSGINGQGITVTLEQIQPGKYVEVGGRLEYYHPVLDWLTIGANIEIAHRAYASAIDLITGLPFSRRDVMVTPGATILFRHIMRDQSDIRVDYRFQHNDSNDPLRDFVNHLVTVMFVSRF